MYRKSGFTLVETLIVIAIIGLLAAIIFPIYAGVKKKAYQTQCTLNLKAIQMQIAMYKQDNGVYPAPETPVVTMLVGANKLGAKYATCPRDNADDKHDTYSEFYNYWGYKSISNPKPVKSKNEAEALYNPLTQDASGQRYWHTDTLNAEDSGPGQDFPGLANNAPPSNTIITVCPNHTDVKGMYLILRLSGEVDPIPPTGSNFWTLSR
ncbi:MAG: type II secretion system protein [Armatimonadota bacterium]